MGSYHSQGHTAKRDYKISRLSLCNGGIGNHETEEWEDNCLSLVDKCVLVW